MPLVPNPLGPPVVSETKFFQPGLQFPGNTPVLVEGDDSGWWASIQKYGATVALAAALVATSLSTTQAIQVYSWQQDDPALSAPPSNIVDEDYWQGPQLTQTDDPTLFWYGDGYAITLVTLDEDYWQNPVSPWPPPWTSPQQWTFDEQFPIQAVTFEPDEDFWVNPVLPAPATFVYPQQTSFDEQFPTLFGQPDEDFWWNQVQSVPVALQYPQPCSFDEQFPALHGQFDEDFWANPVAPAPVTLYQPLPYLFDSSEIVPQPVNMAVFVPWIAEDDS